MLSVSSERCLWGGLFVAVVLSATLTSAEPGTVGSKTVVSAGTEVSLEYTLKLKDKAVVESNVGREAMTYRHGAHEIVPGLEKALEGLAVGDKRLVEVSPADGYGEVDPKALQEVKKTQVPERAWKVGVELEAKGSDGQSMFPRVVEVKSETIVLDFNHPLAGKTLFFEITILDIKQGKKQPS